MKIHCHFYCILIISLVSVTADPVPEFQFPCYVDVCTFPRQYCNSDRNERRCSPCTRRLCQKEDLPRACLYYCQTAGKQIETTTLFPQTHRAVESNWRDKSEVYMVYMVIFIAVTNTIVLGVVLFTTVWLLRFCGTRKKAPLTPMQRFLSEPGERDIEMPLMQDGTANRHRDVVLSVGESEQDSAKSLPPYTSKETQFISVLRDSSKTTSSTDSELDRQIDSVNTSKRSSPINLDKTIQVEERELSSKAHLCNPYVSSPTRDKQHEYHEKPWKLGDNTERVDSVESVLRTRNTKEETCLKHSNMESSA